MGRREDERPLGLVCSCRAIATNSARTIIVETANRFARDLTVQEVGFAMLRDLGVTLIAVAGNARQHRREARTCLSDLKEAKALLEELAS
jgi:hypothetical protein